MPPRKSNQIPNILNAEKKEAMMQGINKFLFWNWNFDTIENPTDHKHYPDALMEAKWTCNRQHMLNKWSHWCKLCNNNTADANIKFYGELDGQNRRAFLSWIVENYQDEQTL